MEIARANRRTQRQAQGAGPAASPWSGREGVTGDAVQGWHGTLEVKAIIGTGEIRRADYRRMFEVENRYAPLSLAVVGR
jgi:hypothetical protein